MEGKFIVASGPVIIEDGKLLVDKDDKDDFYKLPGGTVKEGETLEEGCHRKVKEEINGEVELIKPLSPNILWENPQTKEKMTIVLINYLAKLKNKDEIKPIAPTQEIKWLDIEEIKQGKHFVSPNTKALIEKEDLR
ncbi:MAG: NUDIX hydrolase [Nanoarchaeota archaeon]|nr:NUDIX hydrolase [Nanoarchaeota archaeon]